MKTTILISLLLAATIAVAKADPPTLIITEENDFFGQASCNQDRHYTQGLKLAYLSDGTNFTKAVSMVDHLIPTFGLQNQDSHMVLTFGQNIYTPINLASSGPIANDRPYAGWLYGGLVFQNQGTTFNCTPTLDSYELNFGVVGPTSLAKNAQSQWHAWNGDTTPNGWQNQLKNEPGLDLKYERSWRIAPFKNLSRFFDIVPNVGCDLGNVRTAANAGGILRLGYNLPQDFGTALIDEPTKIVEHARKDFLSLYTIVGVEGHAVARDIFIEGNSFADSQGVTCKPLVGDFLYGAGLRIWNHLELSYINVVRSRQFVGQTGSNDQFGSMTLKMTYGF